MMHPPLLLLLLQLGWFFCLLADTNNSYFHDYYITTICGTGRAGFSEDGTPAVSTMVNTPNHLTVDSVGNVYFADSNNHLIRMVFASNHTVITVAGSGVSGYTGDGGLATNARLFMPYGVALDAKQNVISLHSLHCLLPKSQPACDTGLRRGHRQQRHPTCFIFMMII
jgi:hypothetical protein